eukprot:877198_1
MAGRKKRSRRKSGVIYNDLKYKYIRGLKQKEHVLARQSFNKARFQAVYRAIGQLGLEEEAIKSASLLAKRDFIGEKTTSWLKEIEKSNINEDPPPNGIYAGATGAMLVALHNRIEALRDDNPELRNQPLSHKDLCVTKEVLVELTKPICDENLDHAFRDSSEGLNIWNLRMGVVATKNFVKQRSKNKLPFYEMLPEGMKKAQRLIKLMSSAGNQPSALVEQSLYTNVSDGTDGLILLVDGRERGGDSHELLTLCNKINAIGIRYRTIQLPPGLGDYLWVYRCNSEEYPLTVWAERKEVTDLAASMTLEGRGKRFDEESLALTRYAIQKSRMLQVRQWITSNFPSVTVTLQYILEGVEAAHRHVVRHCCGCQSVGKCGNPSADRLDEEVEALHADARFQVFESSSVQGTLEVLKQHRDKLQTQLESAVHPLYQKSLITGLTRRQLLKEYVPKLTRTAHAPLTANPELPHLDVLLKLDEPSTSSIQHCPNNDVVMPTHAAIVLPSNNTVLAQVVSDLSPNGAKHSQSSNSFDARPLSDECPQVSVSSSGPHSSYNVINESNFERKPPGSVVHKRQRVEIDLSQDSEGDIRLTESKSSSGKLNRSKRAPSRLKTPEKTSDKRRKRSSSESADDKHSENIPGMSSEHVNDGSDFIDDNYFQMEDVGNMDMGLDDDFGYTGVVSSSSIQYSVEPSKSSKNVHQISSAGYNSPHISKSKPEKQSNTSNSAYAFPDQSISSVSDNNDNNGSPLPNNSKNHMSSASDPKIQSRSSNSKHLDTDSLSNSPSPNGSRSVKSSDDESSSCTDVDESLSSRPSEPGRPPGNKQQASREKIETSSCDEAVLQEINNKHPAKRSRPVRATRPSSKCSSKCPAVTWKELPRSYSQTGWMWRRVWQL